MKPRKLTASQRSKIRTLVADVTIASDVEFERWSRKRLEGASDLFEQMKAKGLPSAKERRARLERELMDSSARYLGNETARASYMKRRERDRKALEELIAALEVLCREPELRARLYLAAEYLAGSVEPGSLAELGCIKAKCEDEGVALATFDDDGFAAGIAKWYRAEFARHPGAWVRDEAERLIRSARYVLGEKPFKGDRGRPDRDDFIRSLADAWEYATCRAAAAGAKVDGRGPPSPFTTLIAKLFREIEPDDPVTESAYVERIRLALKRRPAGALLR